MNSKQLKFVPIALTLAIGSGQALANSGWYYDKGSDTIVFTAEGSRSGYTPSKQPVNRMPAPAGSWYYDGDSDTIVYSVEGSRSGYDRSVQSGDQGSAPLQSWYHDEHRDTIVYNVEGSRSDYIEADRSM